MPSFDIISKTSVEEIDNALQGVEREINQRFDFKGSKCSTSRQENEVIILADDELKLKQMHELLKIYLTRRKLEPSALDFQTAEKASGNTLRQKIIIKQGINQDISKQITRSIKDQKLKVQAAIQGDEIRITGKKRDDLQEAIQLVRDLGLSLPLQFVNFRD